MKVLITAGPTYERIDPVRFIGNYSSGKMGIKLTEECLRRGIDVELVLGPVDITPLVPEGKNVGSLNITHVESAQDMYEECMRLFPSMDGAILCAAVADFTPIQKYDCKIKREALREKDEELVIRLKPTQDIAAQLGKIKTESQVLAGFALETNNEVGNAQDKLKRKNFDFIVLNSLNDEGAGFRYDTNKISIISKDGKKDFPLQSKRDCAVNITDSLLTCYTR